jgi:coenzyme F420-dependent glucose-6-phosphate dehydrogenase
VGQTKKVIASFRQNGGAGKPVYLKVQLSFDKTHEQALNGAYDQWRTNIFEASVVGELWKVDQFDALGDRVQPHEMESEVLISCDVRQHSAWIREFIDLGIQKVILHNVNREQERFISSSVTTYCHPLPRRGNEIYR